MPYRSAGHLSLSPFHKAVVQSRRSLRTPDLGGGEVWDRTVAGTDIARPKVLAQYPTEPGTRHGCWPLEGGIRKSQDLNIRPDSGRPGTSVSHQHCGIEVRGLWVQALAESAAHPPLQRFRSLKRTSHRRLFLTVWAVERSGTFWKPIVMWHLD